MIGTPASLADPGAKASDRAYQSLRQMIVSMKLEPGSAIDEKRMSLQLGLGRTPVREALLKLADQRLVQVLPRRGTFVTPIRLNDLRAVEELRWPLESLATRWAAERRTPDEVVVLRRLVADAEAGLFAALEDWDVEVDRSFHLLIAQAAKNPFLAEQLTRLYDHSVRLLYATRTQMVPAIEELPDYRYILDAIEGGDGVRAEAGMQRHLLASRAQVASGFEATFTRSATDGPTHGLGRTERTLP